MNAKAQLRMVREKLAQLDSNNRDHLAEIAQLKSQELELIKQVEAEEAEAEFEAKAEERLNQEISFNIPGVDFTDLPAPVIQLISEVVRHDREKLLAEHKEELLELHAQLKEVERAAEEREEQLRRQNNELQEKLTETERELLDVKFSLEKMTEQRDNAARIIDEQKEEIEQLNIKIEELQRAKAADKKTTITIPVSSGKTMQQLIDEVRNAMMPIYEEERKKKEKEAYIKVTEKQQVNSNTYRVVIAATGEEKMISWLEQGRYILVSEEEAEEERARFRAEQEAEKAEQVEESVESDLALVKIDPPTFQIPAEGGQDDAAGVSGVQPEASGGDHGDQRANDAAISLESFEKLEERVSALEVAIFGKPKGAA